MSRKAAFDVVDEMTSMDCSSPISASVMPSTKYSCVESAAMKALELNPLSAEAHRVLAQMAWNFEFDWASAEREYRLAVGLNPQSPLVRWWYGAFLGVQGRFDEAREHLQRGRELDPLAVNIIAVSGWMDYFDRHFEESLSCYRRVLEIDPFNVMTHWMLGEAQVELGDFDAGIASLEDAPFLSPRSARFAGYLGDADRDTMPRDLEIDPPLEMLKGCARYNALLANVGLRL